MLPYLSPGWISALDGALRAAPELDAVPGTVPAAPVVIEHHVTEAPAGEAPEGEIVYHVTLGGGATGAASGPAPEPTVVFRQSYATARAIATGTESAQSAFVRGGLRVEGDVPAITELGTALARLTDVLAGLRDRTEF